MGGAGKTTGGTTVNLGVSVSLPVLHPGGRRFKYMPQARPCRVTLPEPMRPPGEGAIAVLTGLFVGVNNCRLGRGQQLSIPRHAYESRRGAHQVHPRKQVASKASKEGSLLHVNKRPQVPLSPPSWIPSPGSSPLVRTRCNPAELRAVTMRRVVHGCQALPSRPIDEWGRRWPGTM